MSSKPDTQPPLGTTIDQAQATEPALGRPAPAGLEVFLPDASASPRPSAEHEARSFVGVRSARLLSHAGRLAVVELRGEAEPRQVRLDPEVDAQIVADALESGERVLVEADEEGEVAIIGVLRSRVPEKLVLRADKVEIEGDSELLLHSGKGALRLRQDGDIELVGSRISAASRGLFRLVGRMLRLN